MCFFVIRYLVNKKIVWLFKTLKLSFLGIATQKVYISRRELLNIMQYTDSNKMTDKIKFLRMELIKQFKPSNMMDFMKKFHNFITDFKARWAKSYRKEEIFSRNNENWLNSSITFLPPTKRGRKELSFEECNEKTKARKCKDLRDNNPFPLLAHATQMSLRASGQRTVSNIIKDIMSSPNKAKNIKKKLTLLSKNN